MAGIQSHLRSEAGIDADAPVAAVRGGCSEVCPGMLCGPGCPVDSRTAVAAAGTGSLPMLMTLWQLGVELTPAVVVAAAAAGHLDTLVWAHGAGFPLSNLAAERAAAAGRLDVVTWLTAHACPHGPRVCAAAASGGHLAVLQALRASGCPWDAETTSRAAGAGHLDLLAWALQNGCPITADALIEAAAGGHLDVLRWANSFRCYIPWSDRCCNAAAWGGRLEVLQWLVGEAGMAMGQRTTMRAAQQGHLHVLRWAIDAGCPWSASTCTSVAMAGGHVEVLDWLRKSGALDYDTLQKETLICRDGLRHRDRVMAWVATTWMTDAGLAASYMGKPRGVGEPPRASNNTRSSVRDKMTTTAPAVGTAQPKTAEIRKSDEMPCERRQRSQQDRRLIAL
eukprot:jgi/Tetstr1/447397/TSEL_034833.t1